MLMVLDVTAAIYCYYCTPSRLQSGHHTLIAQGPQTCLGFATCPGRCSVQLACALSLCLMPAFLTVLERTGLLALLGEPQCHQADSIAFLLLVTLALIM